MAMTSLSVAGAWATGPLATANECQVVKMVFNVCGASGPFADRGIMVAGASGRRQNAAHFASNDAHHSGFQRRRVPDYMVLAGAAASSSHRDEHDPGTATSNASSPAQRL